MSERKNEVANANDEITTLEGRIKALESDIKALKGASVSKASGGNMDASKGEGKTYNATYYSAYCPTCGEWGGITATGDDISSSIYVRGKRVVAVDPSVIPLGSVVKVTTPYETFEALALDTGGDIKGRRIDILVEATEKAYSLGRHDVKVEVLN